MILPGSVGVLDKVVLEAGAGGITICEVQIRKGPAYGVMVDPQPDREVYRAAEELCEGLWARRDGGKEDEENSKGVSRKWIAHCAIWPVCHVVGKRRGWQTDNG